MVRLSILFKNENLSRIIEFFLQSPSIELNQTELGRKLKMSKMTIIKWLSFLAKKEIINIKKMEVSNLCSLNKGKPLVKQLKILNNLMGVEELEDKFKDLNVNLQIYMYGSAARGEDKEDSDVDLLVVSDYLDSGGRAVSKKRSREVVGDRIIFEIGELSKKIKREIKPLFFTSSEWINMEKKDKAFYERVEKDKIEILKQKWV